MNELFFNWRKHLNIKKVIITIIVIITFIFLIFFLVTPKEKAEETPNQTAIYNSEKNTTLFFNTNRSISIELSNIYNLKQYIPQNNYLLEIRSDKNLNIFLSEKDAIEGKVLKDIALADQLAFAEEFQSVSNTSELKEISINSQPAYTYSFHYLDTNLNTTFYIQITWLEIDNHYYIFDIEFPLDDLQLYTNVIIDTLSSFKVLGQ